MKIARKRGRGTLMHLMRRAFEEQKGQVREVRLECKDNPKVHSSVFVSFYTS